MKVEATIDEASVKALQDKLHTLAYRGASRASGKAIRAGLKVMERAQKASVEVVSGLLRRSIGSRFLKKNKQRRGAMTAMAGMNVGKKKPPKQVTEDQAAYKKTGKFAFHGHLYSLGSRDRWAGIKYKYDRRKKDGDNYVGEELTGKKVRFTGAMPANPAFRLASQAAEPAAVAQIASVLATEIEREAAKAK